MSNYLRTYSNDELKKLVNLTGPTCNIYLRVYSLQTLLHTPRALHRPISRSPKSGPRFE
jgi:hypothetical protein